MTIWWIREFTVNFDRSGGYRINLLQCRPLQTITSPKHKPAKLQYKPEHIMFSTKGNTMGYGLQKKG